MACEPQAKLSVFDDACDLTGLGTPDRTVVRDVMFVYHGRDIINVYPPATLHGGSREQFGLHRPGDDHCAFITGSSIFSLDFIVFGSPRMSRCRNGAQLLTLVADLVLDWCHQCTNHGNAVDRIVGEDAAGDPTDVYRIRTGVYHAFAHRRIGTTWECTPVVLPAHVSPGTDGAAKAFIAIVHAAMKEHCRGL